MSQAESAVLTLAEVADALRVSRAQAQALVDSGKLPHFNVGIGNKRRHIRVRRADLDAFMSPVVEVKPVAVPTPRSRLHVDGPLYF